MDLSVGAHSRTSIRRPVAEPLANVIEGAARPRGLALASIRELAGFSGINSDTVTRAIEDLKRSGYRPLLSGPAAPPRASIPEAPPSPARHPVDSRDGMPGSHDSAKEGGS